MREATGARDRQMQKLLPIRSISMHCFSGKPTPGAMFLFPSYLWHHTVPLETGAERVSIAFDIVPA